MLKFISLELIVIPTLDKDLPKSMTNENREILTYCESNLSRTATFEKICEYELSLVISFKEIQN